MKFPNVAVDEVVSISSIDVPTGLANLGPAAHENATVPPNRPNTKPS